MENATHAIAMAAGILFAILTLSLFVYMFNNMALMKNAEADKKQAEELTSWNMQWEAYNKQYLYGLDVLTVVNKVVDMNYKYNNSPEYKITVTVEIEGVQEYCTDDEADITNIRAFLYDDKKTKIFSCTEMERNEYGRINRIYFEEQLD